ncbi:hypothetical protein [Bradyrhizobium sp. 170]|uniref:hypothetical protein n=1 Tax=Bradyrhizobium sp. 170 TaxID=2782641 RepID=UPI001FFF59F5|nr:hypothetical protein [Bradyrhizobium sp. 170]UPK03604.1 hypothetical protein IVB05_39960 [Bradyrhizobium sp. 170]
MRTPSIEGEPRPRTKRKGFFTRLLEALHRSRRRDAIRVLRRYRHLIAGQAQVRPAKPVPESRQTEKSSQNAHGNNTRVRADRKARRDTGIQST